jgi:hypothetical protein
MNRIFTLAVAVAAALAPSCGGETVTEKANTVNIQIKVGSKTFTATLENSATTHSFKAQLPMTVKMTELNGNEKYFRFSSKLPTNASNPGMIKVGDLMIYGQDTLVLFYEGFQTSYSYTRLGRINDSAGLAAALGSGSATVTYELQEEAKGN